MKIIAYYLPQFHEIPENDEWWGKGFTEWTNVRKGKPLFKGHDQPRVPSDGYYNLLDKEVMIRQARLANEYGVHGMAFYHYWYEGKKLLEKPAENLLAWTDIPMNFMFFWANHDWVRSWDGKKTMLQKQTYGGEKDWIEHFEYMLPFFKDSRYIRINGVPAIGIYDAAQIPQFDRMAVMWKKLAEENGLGGLYIIESYTYKGYTSKSEKSDAVCIREPNLSMNMQSRLYGYSKRYPKLQKFFPGCYPGKFSYDKAKKDEVCIAMEFKSDKDIIYGDFVGWDNTCRHGKRGSILSGQNVVAFERTLRKLKELADTNGVGYVFLNAWNEWCEGMYLEPDQSNESSYLEVIRKIQS